MIHSHGEHAGSIDVLVDLLPGLELAASQRAARFLKGERSLLPDEGQSKLRGQFVQSRKPVDVIIGDGDEYGSLAVGETPGHTPGHLAFIARRDGTCLAGDAFQTQGGLAVSGVLRLGFPLPALATGDKARAVASARKIAGLKPAQLAVGHGPVLTQPDPRSRTSGCRHS